MHQEEIELEILKSLGKVTSQRTIADEIGYSAGKVNYVLKKLVEKGLVKVDRFVNSKSKVQYKYLLTPEGIKEKISKFIENKYQIWANGKFDCKALNREKITGYHVDEDIPIIYH